MDIPKNLLAAAVNDEVEQLVEKCVSWLSKPCGKSIQVMWYIYGGVKDEDNENSGIARRKVSCREVALQIAKKFKCQGYYYMSANIVITTKVQHTYLYQSVHPHMICNIQFNRLININSLDFYAGCFPA
ncbi:hypothetical protein [Bacteroides ovatus]|uniref:hypothetical protein n=1 Tax=Bacteroides ovatus TaxID=28116 RepID=UPI00202E9962|nr:hypothetical protein [Bacteroides ovatus]MCM1723334.1 hypothetical protein [Bacteroides ovatus]MCM1757655.1 hypothetical protein [Bacteroides ovatus]MCM1869084.1 hypothetical protein [Bacteroides ovatus]MCM1912690.1 hypothetical protein [Bacteroides ovatus]